MPVDNLHVQTESTNWRGKKYKCDYVQIIKNDNIRFEVLENEVIAFFFIDHIHFEDYSFELEDGQPDYISRAQEFFEKLFTLPIERKRFNKERECFITF